MIPASSMQRHVPYLLTLIFLPTTLGFSPLLQPGGRHIFAGERQPPDLKVYESVARRAKHASLPQPHLHTSHYPMPPQPPINTNSH